MELQNGSRLELSELTTVILMVPKINLKHIELGALNWTKGRLPKATERNKKEEMNSEYGKIKPIEKKYKLTKQSLQEVVAQQCHDSVELRASHRPLDTKKRRNLDTFASRSFV